MFYRKTNTQRRQFLKNLGTVSLAGASTMVLGCKTDQANTKNTTNNPNTTTNDKANCLDTAKNHYDFYGEHQAGIITPVQRHIYFLVADLNSHDITKIRQMFKDWTDYSVKLTQGHNIKPYDNNPHVPPTDTGEADSLNAYGLTLTFGVSLSFLDKLNLQDKKPAIFQDLPAFPRDQIKAELSGGDICIQACADDPQVAFHAVRQLVRQARSLINMRWSQSGFNSFDDHQDTPRNLFGFKDGTANKITLQNPNEHLWIQDNHPAWLKGGTYLVTRIIKMHLETWDRTSLSGQEETFARHRHSGAPLGSKNEFDTFDAHAKNQAGENIMPEVGHTTLANQTGKHLLRRSFSYSSGIDTNTGQFNAGLLFISFQQNPEQFIHVQNALGRIDKMNEYITHIGSGLFACFSGIKQGEYIGQALFDNV